MTEYFDKITDMCAKTEMICRINENTINAFCYTDKNKQLSKQKELIGAMYKDQSEILFMLKKDFLPPIEREDICALSQLCVKNALCAHAILENIILFKTKAAKSYMREISAAITKMAEHTTKAAAAFKSKQRDSRLFSACEEIKALFFKAKKTKNRAVSDMFSAGSTTLEIALGIKEAEGFFGCARCFYESAMTAEKIALKNA